MRHRPGRRGSGGPAAWNAAWHRAGAPRRPGSATISAQAPGSAALEARTIQAPRGEHQDVQDRRDRRQPQSPGHGRQVSRPPRRDQEPERPRSPGRVAWESAARTRTASAIWLWRRKNRSGTARQEVDCKGCDQAEGQPDREIREQRHCEPSTRLEGPHSRPPVHRGHRPAAAHPTRSRLPDHDDRTGRPEASGPERRPTAVVVAARNSRRFSRR